MQSTETTIAQRIELLAKIISIIAGFGATIAFCGFVLLRSNAALLGVSQTFHHSVSEYFNEGTVFFLTTFFLYFPYGLFCAVIKPIFIIFIIIICLVTCSFYVFDKKKAFRNRFQKRLPKIIVTIVSLVVALALLCAALVMLYTVQHRDLLFATEHSGGGLNISSAIDETQQLRSYSIGITFAVAGSVFLLALAARSNKYRSLFLMLSTIVPISYLIIHFPMAYGQKVFPNHYHRVMSMVEDENGIEQVTITADSTLYFLRNENDMLILFDKSSRTLIIKAKQHVKYFSLGKKQNILSAF